MELDPEEPPSLEELQARYRKAEKIRNILTRSRSALALPGSGSPPVPPLGCLLGRPWANWLGVCLARPPHWKGKAGTQHVTSRSVRKLAWVIWEVLKHS